MVASFFCAKFFCRKLHRTVNDAVATLLLHGPSSPSAPGMPSAKLRLTNGELRQKN